MLLHPFTIRQFNPEIGVLSRIKHSIDNDAFIKSETANLLTISDEDGHAFSIGDIYLIENVNQFVIVQTSRIRQRDTIEGLVFSYIDTDIYGELKVDKDVKMNYFLDKYPYYDLVYVTNCFTITKNLFKARMFRMNKKYALMDYDMLYDKLLNKQGLFFLQNNHIAVYFYSENQGRYIQHILTIYGEIFYNLLVFNNRDDFRLKLHYSTITLDNRDYVCNEMFIDCVYKLQKTLTIDEEEKLKEYLKEDNMNKHSIEDIMVSYSLEEGIIIYTKDNHKITTKSHFNLLPFYHKYYMNSEESFADEQLLYFI